jgi:hypothetical protein
VTHYRWDALASLQGLLGRDAPWLIFRKVSPTLNEMDLKHEGVRGRCRLRAVVRKRCGVQGATRCQGVSLVLF